jgi:cyclopropane-fatty-acyl-phospholipid synthase
MVEHAAPSALTDQKVAIVGGGVAGLSAAWHLSVNTGAHVQLFEAESRLGGHAYTTNVDGVDVDIGFMVYNETNYPNMVEWFRTLGVTQEDSDMSLSVSLDGGDTVEWSSDGLDGLFANRRQLVSPPFYRFLKDMIRFNQQAANILLLTDDDPRKHVTTAQYLREHGYSTEFAKFYVFPMMAALWSASMEDVLRFPAAQLIGFLCNHKMLQLFDRPQWKTVAGRSQQYTNLVQSILGPEAVHLDTPVHKVEKLEDQTYRLVTLRKEDGEHGSATEVSLGVFDQVVFACHPPTAHDILQRSTSVSNNPTNKEHQDHQLLLQLLAQIEYADNVVYVHSDPSLMPKRRHAWASWNCLGRSQHMLPFHSTSSKKGEAFEGAESGFGNVAHSALPEDQDSFHEKTAVPAQPTLEGIHGRMKAVFVTYWLNRLQNLETDRDIFVSLNPHHAPEPALTHQRVILAHPQFNSKTLQARENLGALQGKDGLWFCGAWSGYGFHEDGCRDGFRVATAMSAVPLPWATEARATDETPSTPDALILPPPDLSSNHTRMTLWQALYQRVTYDLPVAICRQLSFYFMKQAVQMGRLRLKFNDGSVVSFGDGTPCGCDTSDVTIRVFDPWFFVKLATEYDLGLARSYMAGHFIVEPLEKTSSYHPVIRPEHASEEATITLGDPIGLTRLFLLLIGNRDDNAAKAHTPRRAGRGHKYANALSNASGLVLAQMGSFVNYLRYKLTMDNSERGGSLKNIHAHYDLSNDLFKTFLDKETLMYSSAIYDAVPAPRPHSGLVFRGSLEEAQWRKLDTLLDRAQIQPGQTVLDIGFGWGGLSIHAAKKYGCKVTGITLSVEQKALAEKRVKEEGIESLITFEVVDYRTFCARKSNCGMFDRVLSCEMIEAVGHGHLVEFFWAVEQVLCRDGVLVMEAITTPEERYENYLRSTDFINTIIFPGSCCPSLHALVDAAYRGSTLTLEHVDNIGLHYAQTLAEWRRRFNAEEPFVRQLGFDDVFLRAWNYYLTYCEAGFFSQTENCLILVFARPGCKALTALCETRSVVQASPFSDKEIETFVAECK